MNNNTRKGLLRFDRILSQGILSQLLLLVGILFVAWVFANIILLLSPCDWKYFCEVRNINRFAAPFYLLIDGNAFNSVYIESPANGWTVFLACIIYILGSFIFTGMMISVITNMVERRVEMHRNGLVSYLKKDHYIIMGYDDSLPSFIRYIFNKDKEAYILILSAKNAVEIREKLQNVLSKEQMKHIIFNYGHRIKEEGYAKIHLESCKEVFIVGYGGSAAHDAINVECVDAICRYLKRPEVSGHPKRITCVFRDIDTYAAFKTTEIFTEVRNLDMEFIPYNYQSGWARQILTNRFYSDADIPESYYPYPTLYGKGIVAEDPHYVHLVFAGTTNFAVAMATEAAQTLHFPNFNSNPALRTRITFIDVNADTEKSVFITRNRYFFAVQPYYYRDLSDTESPGTAIECRDSLHLSEGAQRGRDYDFLDVEFEFIKGDIFSSRVQDWIRLEASDTEHQYLAIFLAMADQQSNFVLGMNMPDEVYDNAIPLFIRQDRSDNFVTDLRTASGNAGVKPYARIVNGDVKVCERPMRYANIYPFGMEDAMYETNEVQFRRAKLINYLYASADWSKSIPFTRMEELEAMPASSIKADADEKWKELSVAKKWSNLYHAYSLKEKLDNIAAMRGVTTESLLSSFSSLTDDEVMTIAKVEHNRWNVEKLLMGFRKPTKDEDKYEALTKEAGNLLKKNKDLMIHHDIRPFDVLDNVWNLDYEFSRYIPWIIKMSHE